MTRGFKAHPFTYQKLIKEEDIGLDLPRESYLDDNFIKEVENESENIETNISSKFKRTGTKDTSNTKNYDDNEYNDIKQQSIRASLLNESASESKVTDYRKKNYDAVITEYCPIIFNNLINEDGLEYSEILNSIDPFKNRKVMMSIKESAGKSGSFFFFTHDNRFIIKTVKDHELNTMLGSFMEHYYLHIMSNPESLLTRIYGLFTINIR